MLDTEFENSTRAAQCPLPEDGIAAQIDESACLKFPSSFLSSRYPAFWRENIALTPDEAGKILTAGLENHETIIEITKGKGPHSLNIAGIIYGHHGKDIGFEEMMSGPKIQETGRDIDLEAGTMHPGFIRAENMKGGRTFLRNQFELGYALGCNNLRINTANIGSWLWTQGFNVESVQPKYMDHLHKVYNEFKDGIDDPDIQQAFEKALENEDMQALAAIDYEVNLNARYASEFSSTIAREGRLLLSKAMMIKHTEGNWTGVANLQDPRDCARLGQCLGGWNNPQLQVRAAQYAKPSTASAPTGPQAA